MNAALKMTLVGWLSLSGLGSIAVASPLPPPGCGLVCGTITLIKDQSLGIPFADPESGLGPPWVSYQLDVYLPSFVEQYPGLAFDVVIKGQLHQRWSDFNGDGIFEPSANHSDTTAGDSHLLVPSLPNAVFGHGPLENNSGNGSPLVDTPVHDYGVGTTLAGAWAFLTPVKSASIVYLVVPRGFPLDITVRYVSSDDAVGGRLTTSDFIFVPEPTTMTLAALAIFGWSSIARRRTSRSKR